MDTSADTKQTRAPRITPEDVYKCAKALLVEDRMAPTTINVRNRLQRGSMQTIQKMLPEAIGRISEEVAHYDQRPDIPQPVFEAAKTLWYSAKEIQSVEVEKQLREARELKAVADEMIKAAEDRIQMSDKQKQVLEVSIADKNSEIERLYGYIDGYKQKLDSVNFELTNTQNEVDKLTADIEHIQVAHAEEKERAEAYFHKTEKHLSESIDELKLAAKKQKQAHAKALKEKEAELAQEQKAYQSLKRDFDKELNVISRLKEDRFKKDQQLTELKAEMASLNSTCKAKDEVIQSQGVEIEGLSKRLENSEMTRQREIQSMTDILKKFSIPKTETDS